MNLSVALIVKDEEEFLPDCLASVQDADEIVVVDTGSSDRTVEIAQEFTDNIVFYEWGDDFGAARNVARANCSGEWIYSIDADHLNLTPIEEVKAEVERVKADHSVASITIDDHHSAAWLFQSAPDNYWVGRVHEVLSRPATVETSVRQVTRPREEPHTKRNLRILQKSPDNARTRFYLGREYFELGDYAKAVSWMRRYLNRPAFPAEEAEAWLTLAKAEWFQHQGDAARAACLQAIGVNPDFTEALHFMASLTYEPWRSKWTHIADNSTNQDVLFRRVGAAHQTS
jgi:glycosyltransferase involved in cell wall biosynthesis